MRISCAAPPAATRFPSARSSATSAAPRSRPAARAAERSWHAAAKFCAECGAKVAGAAREVPEKERPLRDVRAYTPKHLADRILQSRSALEGERKQVTVLFADVKGSMELAEQLGAEDLARRARSVLRDPQRRRAPLRGHRQPVHRRRHHGAVRRADRARGSRAARLLRGAARCATRCASSRAT